MNINIITHIRVTTDTPNIKSDNIFDLKFSELYNGHQNIMYQQLLDRLIVYHNNRNLYDKFQSVLFDVSLDKHFLFIDMQTGIVNIFEIFFDLYNSKIKRKGNQVCCIRCHNYYNLVNPLSWIYLCSHCLNNFNISQFGRINSTYPIKFLNDYNTYEMRHSVSNFRLELWYKFTHQYKRVSLIINDKLTNLRLSNNYQTLKENSPFVRLRCCVCHVSYIARFISLPATNNNICASCNSILLKRNRIQLPFVIDKILAFNNVDINNDVKTCIIKLLIYIIF